MTQRQKGHIYGLKTKNGIAILQLSEEPETPTSLQLTRVCDGFLEGEYTDEDILRIVRRPERFFLETPLRAIGPRSRVYREFFAFDRPFALPDGLELPKYQRGFVVRSDGSVQWYKKAPGRPRQKVCDRADEGLFAAFPGQLLEPAGSARIS